jgi:hypothetical protein
MLGCWLWQLLTAVTVLHDSCLGVIAGCHTGTASVSQIPCTKPTLQQHRGRQHAVSGAVKLQHESSALRTVAIICCLGYGSGTADTSTPAAPDAISKTVEIP